MTGSPLADHTGLRLTFALIWVVEYAPYEIGRGGGVGGKTLRAGYTTGRMLRADPKLPNKKSKLCRLKPEFFGEISDSHFLNERVPEMVECR